MRVRVRVRVRARARVRVSVTPWIATAVPPITGPEAGSTVASVKLCVYEKLARPSE